MNDLAKSKVHIGRLINNSQTMVALRY
jgi:hypothetical protein